MLIYVNAAKCSIRFSAKIKNSKMQHEKNRFFLFFHENLLYFWPSVWKQKKKTGQYH